MSKEFFTLEKTADDSKARAGTISMDHGDIQTPVFMPVGTQGAVKAMYQRTLHEQNAKIILGNTYHLYLRPGTDVIHKAGGLHKFANWTGNILTDSGGYQVFSLKELRKLSEEGASFSSHLDGSKHLFSPEKVVEIQRYLGSDIMMVLDECTEYPSELLDAKKSMDLSEKWAIRSRKAFLETEPLYGHRQFQFGIGQGSMYPELRRDYSKKLVDIGFEGYAIGGLSVGEPAQMMYDMIEVCNEVLPEDKPRYLMGVGTPENILEGIERGIDMFDCVMPTRNARNGQLFTTRGKINIKNSKYKYSQEPIDENIDSYASKNFTLGYLRHLIMADEITGLMLASEHNIAFYLWLAKTAREKILSGEFRQFKREILSAYNDNKDI
jgi:queuine tRNA-ribosyltransferase